MAVSAFTFKLPKGKGLTNDCDTVVVMANTAAIARALLESHYPLAPKAQWDLVSTPSAEVAQADWKGWRTTVTITPVAAGTTAISGKTSTFQYTGVASDTTNLVAAALNALIVADAGYPGTTVSTDTITLAVADAVGDATITAKVEFVGDLQAVDANINPSAFQNLQAVVAFAPVVQAVQAHGATRTIQVHAITDLPRVVGFYRDRVGL